MLFITQWQAERLAGILTPPPPTDENPAAGFPAEHTDDHLHEEVHAMA